MCGGLEMNVITKSEDRKKHAMPKNTGHTIESTNISNMLVLSKKGRQNHSENTINTTRL